MRDVLKIARAIRVVRPRLKEPKYFEYALGIYRASLKYNIEPSVLIAITQQETAFRQNLPEGRAGERGICQVLKSWLHNPKFKAEFKNAKLSDFADPSKSFMFAAWILADLKARITKGSLPYWSFYNANKFHNRFKYFLLVNKYVALLKKNEHLFDDRAIAAKEVSRALAKVSKPAPAPKPVVAPPPLIMTASLAPLEAEDLPKPIPTRKVDPPAKPLPNYWIPDALRQLQLKQKAKQASAELIRAAHELSAGNLFNNSESAQD